MMSSSSFLLNIPVEIRQSIYEHLFPISSSDLAPPSYKCNPIYQNKTAPSYALRLSILLTCRQLFHECRDFAYSRTVFTVTNNPPPADYGSLYGLYASIDRTNDVGIRVLQRVSAMSKPAREAVRRVALVDDTFEELLNDVVITGNLEPVTLGLSRVEVLSLRLMAVYWGGTWKTAGHREGLGLLRMLREMKSLRKVIMIDLKDEDPKMYESYAASFIFRNDDPSRANLHSKLKRAFLGKVDHLVLPTKQHLTGCVGFADDNIKASSGPEDDIRHVHLTFGTEKEIKDLDHYSWKNDCSHKIGILR